MHRAPYHFARSCVLADETYARATELATRLLALTDGRLPTLRPVMLSRARGPSGAALAVFTGGRPIGYVLRPGCDDLSERVERALMIAHVRSPAPAEVAA